MSRRRPLSELANMNRGQVDRGQAESGSPLSPTIHRPSLASLNQVHFTLSFKGNFVMNFAKILEIIFIDSFEQGCTKQVDIMANLLGRNLGCSGAC